MRQREQNRFQTGIQRRRLRALICLVLICSVLPSRSYVPAHAAHIHSDACYTSSVRAHVHTGSSSTGTGCYAAGEYVAGHTYTCGELDTSSYRTIDRVEYVSHGCTSMELSGYESQYRCKGCGEYVTYYWAVYCSDCDYSSWNGLSAYVHQYYVEPHYELGCGKTEGTFYNMEMHQEHAHCSEKESVCVVCDGTGEMKDHKADWTYPGYDIVSGRINYCVYCGWEDEDGIPCFRYKCNTCGDSISIRGCCDYEKYASEYRYCTVSCSVCDGEGTVWGYFDTCDAGCINSDRCPVCNGYGVRVYPPCPYEAGEYYDGSPAEPVCSQVVTSLVPVSPVQTIMIGESPDIQAVASFLDGTTKTVTCSYTDFHANVYGTAQTVTLSYGTYHDTAKNPGAKTCTISVTVQGYYSLTVSSSNAGMGTVAGGGSKLTGSTVTVKAIPVGSNRFTGWYEGSTLVSMQASYSFTMPARNVTLVAHFIRIPVSLTAAPDRNMVYNGTEPSYTVVVKYSDGTSTVLNSLQYTKTGFTRGAGVKTVHFSYTESGVTVTASITVTVLRNIRTCRYGHSYELSDNDTDEGCSECAATLDSISAYPSEQSVSPGGTPSFLVTGTYLDGHSVALYGWTTDFNAAGGLGEQYVTIRYENFTCKALVRVVKTFTCGVCGTVYEANADLSNPGCPECRRSCVSITASPASQMVEQGSSIQLTVTAKFRDGHTAEVSDWTSNYQPFTLGKQRVAVLYGGQTASVEVEVVAKKAVCINCGTVYDPMQGWCPNCGAGHRKKRCRSARQQRRRRTCWRS